MAGLACRTALRARRPTPTPIGGGSGETRRLRGGRRRALAEGRGTAELAGMACLSERTKRWCGLEGEDEEDFAAQFARAYAAGVADLYDAAANPGGYLVLCRAENKLPSARPLLAKIEEASSGEAAGRFTQRNLGYEDYKGSAGLRAAVARYFSRHALQSRTIDAEDLAISAGSPAPYYQQFVRDLGMRAGVGVVPVPCAAGPARGDLEAAYAAAPQPKPKALLLTNPHNPTGAVYSREQVLEVLRFCEAKGIHCVSDEIYACSIYDEGGRAAFVSVADLAAPGEDSGLSARFCEEKIHAVFGFSKDFGASGLRVGCVHTRNRALLKAWNALGYSCAVSTHTQHVLTQILEQDDFVEGYLRSNQDSLGAAAGEITAALAATGVAVSGGPRAGPFVLIDLRHLLKERSFAGERDLWHRLAAKGVLLNPGETCGCAEPGFFRLCFAWMPCPQEAARRIGEVAAGGQG